MKVLVIGSGGREHAILWRLAKSSGKNELHVAGGNAGMESIAIRHKTNPTDIEALVNLSKDINAELVISGPEAPLVFGLGDKLRNLKIPFFGPSENAARLEGSKAFMKDFCKKYNIPTARFETCSKKEDALKTASKFGIPLVIKTDGLASGKGVLICNNTNEVKNAIESIFDSKKFGSAGNKVIIEEFLTGEEASYIAICDGNKALPLASSQDHKRIFDNDLGPNTGGMGAYSPAPVVTKEVEEKINSQIIMPTLDAMREMGSPFLGALYAGVMIENSKPKLLEFNVRFGDPETQPLMMRMNDDLLSILYSASRGKLDRSSINWTNEKAVCVVMSSGGYPENYDKGDIISGLEETSRINNVYVFHSGTEKNEKGEYITNGGRVLGVTALGKTIAETKQLAYSAVKKISWKNCFYRKDISDRALNR